MSIQHWETEVLKFIKQFTRFDLLHENLRLARALYIM